MLLLYVKIIISVAALLVLHSYNDTKFIKRCNNTSAWPWSQHTRCKHSKKCNVDLKIRRLGTIHYSWICHTEVYVLCWFSINYKGDGGRSVLNLSSSAIACGNGRPSISYDHVYKVFFTRSNCISLRIYFGYIAQIQWDYFINIANNFVVVYFFVLLFQKLSK